MVMSDYPRSSEVEIFHQDVFWKELLVEKRECSEKMLNLRRKRVAGEREDEVLMSLGSLAGQTTGTHTTNNTQLLEIVRLPVAARKGLRTVY